MKKSIFTLIGIFCIVMLNAQLTSYEQDFEVNPLLMPDEITLINVDGMEPDPSQDPGYADSAWIVRPSNGMGSTIAVANSWHVDEIGDADDWMIMPTFSITSDAAKIAWDAMSLTSSGDYPDDYMVIAVVAPDTDPADTVDYVLTNGVILEEVTAEAWEAPVSYEVLLSDHGFSAGTDIWVIFRLTTPAPGGSELGIDNIVLSNGTGLSDRISHEDLDIYPNPASGSIVHFNMNADAASTVQVFDLAGKLIKEAQLGTNKSMNVSDIISGAYIVKVTSGKEVFTSRMIIE